MDSQASARVALAAFLHDLGKFTQRADIDLTASADSVGNSQLSINEQLYCPLYNHRYSHKHAAYTGATIDLIADYLPDLSANNCYPFSSVHNNTGEGHDDSFVNAAAMHHKPITALQWIIATADRLASGFERASFEAYNQAEDEGKGHNYLTARMEVLFEKVSFNGQAPKTSAYRYPLGALAPENLFPRTKEDVQPANNNDAKAEYLKLWEQFLKALKGESNFAIPKSHRADLKVWLSHFDSLWLTFTQAIPAATATKVGKRFLNIPADVSLYDHSKTTAALAVALWRYHEYHHTDKQSLVKTLSSNDDYNDQKFLMIQGDLAGIQDFIFSSGGESSKFAAKLLRGRSAMVSLLSETASLHILDKLGLPSTSQVINAAGKFIILSENTPATVTLLEQAKQTINQWFIKHSYGRASLSLAWLPVSSQDFIINKDNSGGIGAIMKNLFSLLEKQKLQGLSLLSNDTPTAFTNYLDAFTDENGSRAVCALDGKSPATRQKDNVWISELVFDQIQIGDALTQKSNEKKRGDIGQRLLISRNPIECRVGQIGLNTVFFDFYLTFVGDNFTDGEFAALVKQNKILGMWDLSLPIDGTSPLFNGYTRKNVNGYVALTDAAVNYESSKYKRLDDEANRLEVGRVKPLDMLADEDRQPINDALAIAEGHYEAQKYKGLSALHTLKGDIDNLGLIFQKGLEKPTFAKMAALSRQVDSFFSIYLPYLCQTQFKNTYTVFAGGDDFFLIGPWHSQMRLAGAMREAFGRYVAGNSNLSFSAGFYASKPGSPIAHLGELAEQSLDNAKTFIELGATQDIPSKDKVTVFDRTMTWQRFDELLADAKVLQAWREGTVTELYGAKISASFIYGLITLVNMAEEESYGKKPQAAMWRSFLWYRVSRMVERLYFPSVEKAQRKAVEATVSQLIFSKLADAINQYRQDYTVALYSHIYSNRD
jgi:CRISPR-associated protein Csm1